MGVHQMAATEPTELTLTQFRLLIRRDVLRIPEHLDRLWRPQRKCIYRTTGPRAARPTMTITHGIRLAGHSYLDCTAEARTHIRISHRIPSIHVAELWAAGVLT